MKIFMESKSVLSGHIINVYDIGDQTAPIVWEGIVEAFIADEDIQEIVVTSTNIGFTKRIQKVSDDFDLEQYLNDPNNQKE